MIRQVKWIIIIALLGVWGYSSAQNMKKILFVGDSITAAGNWKELLKYDDVVNLGVPGDTTKKVLMRIDAVIAQRPDKVFLMIGINDGPTLWNQYSILRNYSMILDKLQSSLLGVKIYVQSVLPINSEFIKVADSNQAIVELNKALDRICQQRNIVYIDLYPKFIKRKQLNRDLTVDGLHLNSAGYKLWGELLKEYLD